MDWHSLDQQYQVHLAEIEAGRAGMPVVTVNHDGQWRSFEWLCTSSFSADQLPKSAHEAELDELKCKFSFFILKQALISRLCENFTFFLYYYSSSLFELLRNSDLVWPMTSLASDLICDLCIILTWSVTCNVIWPVTWSVTCV